MKSSEGNEKRMIAEYIRFARLLQLEIMSEANLVVRYVAALRMSVSEIGKGARARSGKERERV